MALWLHHLIPSPLASEPPPPQRPGGSRFASVPAPVVVIISIICNHRRRFYGKATMLPPSPLSLSLQYTIRVYPFLPIHKPYNELAHVRIKLARFASSSSRAMQFILWAHCFRRQEVTCGHVAHECKKKNPGSLFLNEKCV